MSVLNNEPYPSRDKLSDDKGYVSIEWDRWFQNLLTTIGLTPSLTGTQVNLTNQNASIAATALNASALSAGLYRVSYVVRVSTVAGVASSIQVTLGWTVDGVPQTFAGANLATNTTTTGESNVKLVHIDANSPITYATTYTSNAAGVMKYSLDVVLELVQQV